MMLCRQEYEKNIAATRDERMRWWREARFGMFVHYGLYSTVGRHEWLMTYENVPVAQYEKLAERFKPKSGAAMEWAALAKKAGMKYLVMTTRHHEGFSLWDSQANPYNAARLGPKRDLVREFVDACRAHDLRIGFYSSLMDWHHPDGSASAWDSEARARFNAYLTALNTELLTKYGKIDVLWYDVPLPMESWEGWDSLERNSALRALQPHLIINDRSRLPEDFGTPEEHVKASADRDWEACMTFNGISWGYVDSRQAAAYSYNAPRILKMLNTCAAGAGNLLLNIGPQPDGSVPPEAVEPLTTVGRWLAENGAAVYGRKAKCSPWPDPSFGGNGLAGVSSDGPTVYLWTWIWPVGGEMAVGGYLEAPRAVRLLCDGKPVKFEHQRNRIVLKDLPKACPDPHAGVTVIAMEFDKAPRYAFGSAYPQLHGGVRHEG
jgi:alpha-L-fucosidase